MSLRVSPTRIRVVDVCVLPRRSRKQIPDWLPILCVEVLGSEDTVEQMAVRCEDYLRMGVPEIWIVDPGGRRFYSLRSAGMIQPEEVFVFAGTSIATEQAIEDD